VRWSHLHYYLESQNRSQLFNNQARMTLRRDRNKRTFVERLKVYKIEIIGSIAAISHPRCMPTCSYSGTRSLTYSSLLESPK
ncbi:hypothetical protein TNCV_2120631, partial [Trichonephila clavipes]